MLFRKIRISFLCTQLHIFSWTLPFYDFQIYMLHIYMYILLVTILNFPYKDKRHNLFSIL